MISDNPYQSSRVPADCPSVKSGVTVRQRFPLDIVGDRIVDLDVGAEELSQRVRVAAQKCGYKVIAEAPFQWTLQRGSLWQALYSFNIGDLPTTTTITWQSKSQVHLNLHCRSCFTVSTFGDEKRIVVELDALELELVRAGSAKPLR